MVAFISVLTTDYFAFFVGREPSLNHFIFFTDCFYWFFLTGKSEPD